MGEIARVKYQGSNGTAALTVKDRSEAAEAPRGSDNSIPERANLIVALAAIATLTMATGARTPVTWFKLCAVLQDVSAGSTRPGGRRTRLCRPPMA